MVTPDIITYVRIQLAAGFTKETISPLLANQGWSPQDIEEAFRIAVSPNVIANESVATGAAIKGGWTLGRVILWIVGIGVIGAVVAAGVGGYYLYTTARNLPDTICANIGDGKHTQQELEICKKTIHNFSGYVANNISNNSSDSRSGAFVEIGDDPILGGYLKPADFNGFDRVHVIIDGSQVSMANVKDRDFYYPLWEGSNAQKQVQALISTSTNIEKATKPEDVAKGLASGFAFSADLTATLSERLYFDNLFKMVVQFAQGCTTSSGWNTQGRWFSCDQFYFVPIEDLGIKADLKFEEVSLVGGKSLSTEIRVVFVDEEKKQRNFGGMSFLVSKDRSLVTNFSSVNIKNYTGNDLLTGMSLGQISNRYPSAEYITTSFDYIKK